MQKFFQGGGGGCGQKRGGGSLCGVLHPTLARGGENDTRGGGGQMPLPTPHPLNTALAEES